MQFSLLLIPSKGELDPENFLGAHRIDIVIIGIERVHHPYRDMGAEPSKQAF
jgi:hypothetical protein